MPTKTQLSTIWESQFEYFGGSGQPRQTYGANLDENGLTTEMYIDSPLNAQRHSDYEGVEIGVLTFDQENNDIKIILSK